MTGRTALLGKSPSRRGNMAKYFVVSLCGGDPNVPRHNTF